MKLENKNYTSIDFSGKNFDGHSMYRCILNGCTFSKAFLCFTTIEKSEVKESFFSNSTIDNARFFSTNLNNAIFDQCKIKHSGFMNSTMHQTVIQNSNIEAVSFNSVDMEEIHILNSKIKYSTFAHASMKHANLENVNFLMCGFENANLNGAVLDSATFKQIRIGNTCFSNTCLDPVNTPNRKTFGLHKWTSKKDHFVGYRYDIHPQHVYTKDRSLQPNKTYESPLFSTSLTDNHPGFGFCSSIENLKKILYTNKFNIIKITAHKSLIHKTDNMYRAKIIHVLAKI